jgi:hypothetical protein
MKDQNFELMAGDYQLLQIDVLDQNDVPYPDLEDAILDWYVCQPPHDIALIHKTSVEDVLLHYFGIMVTSPGTVQVELLGENTEDLDDGEYYHKLTKTVGDKTKTAATGIVTIYNHGSEYFKV